MCKCNQEFELNQEFNNELMNESEYNAEYEAPKVFRPSGVPNTKVYSNPSLGFVMSVPRAMPSKELQDLEEEIVGTKNELKPVLDTTNAPCRWICHLELNFGPDPSSPGNDIVARGSGTLISPRHVLTCGHNLFYDVITGAPPMEVKKIKVTPGYNCAGKIAAPFGFTYAAKKNFPSKWKSSLDFQFDYGLITLKTPIGSEPQKILGGSPLGYWGDKVNGANTRINPQTTDVLKGRTVALSGYPGTKCCYLDIDPNKGCNNSKWGGAQFWSYGKVTNPAPASGPRFLFYDADTYGGHSGSPVWISWQQYRNLVAIHTGPAWPIDASLSNVANRGVRITDEVMNNVRSWM